MITHVIYHISGRKVGCTTNLKNRKHRYLYSEGSVPEIKILEELHDKTDQEAGDREWQWADWYGYNRGTHYTVSRKTPEQRREISRKAGARSVEVTTLEQRRKRGRSGGLQAQALMTLDQCRERARRAGLVAGCLSINRLTAEQRRDMGRKGGLKAAGNLSLNDRKKRARNGGLAGGLKGGFTQLGICPHCGIEVHLGLLSRWHLDRCKHRPMGRRS